MLTRCYSENGLCTTHTAVRQQRLADPWWLADAFVNLPPEQARGSFAVKTAKGCAVVRGAGGWALFSEV